MNLAWNKEGKFFGQSYEDTEVLDSAVLIMPLVFFMQAVRLPLCSSPFFLKLLTWFCVVGSEVCLDFEADLEDS